MWLFILWAGAAGLGLYIARANKKRNNINGLKCCCAFYAVGCPALMRLCKPANRLITNGLVSRACLYLCAR